MEKSVLECFDERGGRMEAHCEQWPGDPLNVFHVKLISETGLRGSFVMSVQGGVTMGAALADRIRREGIHAHN